MRSNPFLIVAIVGGLTGLFAVSSYAQKGLPPAPARGNTPLIDGREADLFNGIVDTDLDKITEDQIRSGDKILKPLYGFEDVFIVTAKTAVIDVAGLGYGPCPAEPNELPIRLSQLGVVTNMTRDGGSEGCRLTAGDKPGATQILWYENRSTVKGKPEPGKLLKVYRVTVTTQDLLQKLQEMKALIGGVEGIEIRVVGDKIVIDGYVLIPKELRRVATVLEKYKDTAILNLVEVNPLSMKLIAKKMEEAIAGGKDRPKDVTVRVVNGRFFLEGLVYKPADRETAVKICLSYLPEKYTPPPPNPVAVPVSKDLPDCVLMVRIRAGQPQDPDPIIAVRVDFVSVSRDYIKNFNFSWAPALGANANATYSSDLGKFVSSFTATLNNLFPILNSAASHGHARVLKTANLLVRDGVNARDPSQGPPTATVKENLKIPYFTDVVGSDGKVSKQVQFLDVTTEVVVKAKSVPGSDKMFLDIKANQAELRATPTTDQLPPTTQNTLETSLVVGNGESAALGGLVTERRKISVVRDPSSSDAKSFTLFEMAKSHDFADQKEQFIVFVTPEKLRSPTEGTENLKRKFRLRK